jgi:RHS Repeat
MMPIFTRPNGANAGRVATQTMNGLTTTYTYDGLGNVATVSGATYPVKYEHTGAGLVKKMWTFRSAPDGTWSNGGEGDDLHV